MQIDDNTPVFYQPGRTGIIDTCFLRDGVLLGIYSGETLEQTALRYPGAQIGKLGPVSEQSENSFKVAPAKISEERYIEMLEVLPPINWTRKNGAETFKLSERTYGNITAIFCRSGEQCYEMQDSIFLSHAQIVARCE